MTLFEYIAGVNLGIDEVLFREPPNQFGSISAGRMHPTTALDFLAMGTATALLAADRGHRLAQGLALLAMLIAGSTLVAYLYGVRAFVGLAAGHQMALHTSLGMLALSAGSLLTRPDRGLMVSIMSDGPGGLMARRILPAAVLIPVVVTGLTILARDANLFSERYGSAVRVTVVVAISVTFIWWNANSLYGIDQERQRVDSERLEGERRIRFLAEAMPQIVWVSRPDGELEYLNGRWFDYTGQDRRQGWSWREILHPDDLGPCLDLWARCTLDGEPYQGEYRFRRHDGAYRWHLARSEPMRDDAGGIVRWVGTSTDIDDQKRVGEQRVSLAGGGDHGDRVEHAGERHVRGRAAAVGRLHRPDLRAVPGLGPAGGDPPRRPRGHEASLGRGPGNRTVYQGTQRLRRHDGVYRHMIARAVPLLDADGTVREWFGVHTDVDDQERAHEAMRAAKDAAEAATRAKGEFLANMSHEIRTPMNGVLGMTELALGTDLTPRQREYLGLVKSSADALLTVIDDILDFSKIEAGKLKLDPVSFAPRDAVTDTLRCLAMRAHDKGLELACRVAPEVPETVVGDPGRLRQVLVNLVGNALKFTERGEVVVAVDRDPDGPSGAALRFSVADTGIGIAPEKRSAIFAPFEQADGSTTRKYGGTGLGLTISSRLIELMGGRIWVEENPGGGSIFRFTARLDGDPEGRPLPTPASPVVLDGLRVLIVDDNRTNRMILEEVLSQWGCRPLAVEGGPQALRAMDRAADRGEPYPLALLDRMMPEMDGCELARRIHANPRHAATRMLMLTSGGRDDSGLARELGIGGVLAKPVRQSELLNALLDLFGPGLASSSTEQTMPMPTPTAATSGRLRVLLAEDHVINQKVATRMLEDQGHEVTIAANGRLAVEAFAASGPFDVILMDVQMPEMDGFEATAAIRSREQPGARVPIAALTAHAMAGDRERCLSAGFDDYLAKPIQAAALANLLARAVGTRGAGTPGPQPAPTRTRPSTSTRPVAAWAMTSLSCERSSPSSSTRSRNSWPRPGSRSTPATPPRSAASATPWPGRPGTWRRRA